MGQATPPELPPGLLEDYRAGVRAQLGVLARIAERLAVEAGDRDALEALRREAHKVHGSAGSYGFTDASRLAAGMEATAKDWAAQPGESDTDRAALTRWFVGRLAEMLKLEVPPRAAASPPRAPEASRAPAEGRRAPVRRLVIRRPAAPPPETRPPPAPRPPPPVAGVPTTTPRPDTAPPATPHAREDLPWIVGPGPRAPSPASAAPREAAPAAAARDAPEVIFVEDDAALAELLEYGLRERGYRFLAYRNGGDALRDLSALEVGDAHPLVLLDVDLPGVDGYSIFDALQRDRPGVYRVVFTTVHGSETEQLRGLEGGALDYLVKPISLRVALEKVRRWVGR